MLKSIWKRNDTILRVLECRDDEVLVIDCKRLTMPVLISAETLQGYSRCEEELNPEKNGFRSPDLLSQDAVRVMHQRFTAVASILPFLTIERERSRMIALASKQLGVSKHTVRKYLCLYLAYQDKVVLAPRGRGDGATLSTTSKNIRWALNRFYYTKNRNSLRTAYTLMLKERYCDGNGNLLSEYPSFHQFRYFYRKHKSLQDYYISREGIRQYQRDHRPLLGDGVQAFASHVGVGMLDSTICDIYLVDAGGGLVGRPILTACIDAYSGLCCGYTLTWEGGTYSLRGLMLSVIEDKAAYCQP